MTATAISVTSSAYSYPLLIKQLLHLPLSNAPDQVIVYRDQVRYSYREFGVRLHRLASGLTALGVRQGDTIGVLDWDSHRYLECFFAIPMMGAVLQMVNVRLNPEQILYTVNHAKPTVLLVHPDFAPLVQSLRAKMDTVRKVVLLREGDEPAPGGFEFDVTYEGMLEAAEPRFKFEDFDENARATTFYTTGTTGLPKGVYFSHRQIVLHTLAVMAAFGVSAGHGDLNRDDVYMPITPMFHVHAWGLPYAATAMGIKQVYPGRYIPSELLALHGREHVTFSHCVPTILQMMLNEARKSEVDLGGWKVIIGGSALSKGLAEEAMNQRMDVFAGYGMSETCPIVSVAHLDRHMLGGTADLELEIRTRAGRTVPLVDLRIVDPDMNDVPADGKTSGEIVIRAPWLTMGYLDNPQASETLWEGGYLHTNDIGYVDDHRNLRITDRIKDVIKTGGEWVSSLEVEDILSRHDKIAEVAVIGVKSSKWGETPLALVVQRQGLESLTVEELRTHMQAFVERGSISKFGIPAKFIFVEQLEKTSVGKYDKKAMRTKYDMVL
jgi:fatty-acyl-CoA synthase